MRVHLDIAQGGARAGQAAQAAQGAEAAARAAQAADFAARMLTFQDRISTAESKGELIRLELARLPSSDLGLLSQQQRARRELLQGQLESNAAEVERLKAIMEQVRAQAAGEPNFNWTSAEALKPVSGTLVPQEFGISKEVMVISGVFTVFVLGPLAIAFAIRLIRRAPTQSSPQLNDMSDRVRRIETAVEAMAIEVERVSESQRYLVKTLGDEPRLPAPKG